jgi:hypothetical protein
MLAAVSVAERAGFAYVTLPDHVIGPEGPDQPRSGWPPAAELHDRLAWFGQEVISRS